MLDIIFLLVVIGIAIFALQAVLAFLALILVVSGTLLSASFNWLKQQLKD